MSQIIGRKEELEELSQIYSRKRAQLVAVYGRRRVGKTFLIREFFKNNFAFYHTGLSPVELEGKSLFETQLKAFANTLNQYGMRVKHRPKDWMEAFGLLRTLLLGRPTNERQVVFIDEMPWMDTPRSGFITAFEAFWNGWASGQDNLMFVVCGSASSWIKDNLINSPGGFYGRVDTEISLKPFTLRESEMLLEANEVELSRYDLMEVYMTTGGIPYYLNQLKQGLSAAEQIDLLFFAQKPKLGGEFTRLFNSTFVSPEVTETVVRYLSTRHSGFSRDEISKHIKIEGAALTNLLRSMEAGDFIRKYQPFGTSKRELKYRLIDPFCWFWLKHVENRTSEPHYWRDNCMSQATRTWRGIAFEELCMNHIPQIKSALGIAAVSTIESAWIVPGNEGTRGAQIDLIITRADNMVHLMEMKCYSDLYSVDLEEEMKLRNRITLVNEQLKKRNSLQANLITTFGLKKGKHSGIYTKALTLDTLYT